ncbi:MAG: ATP-binding protein, partial [Kiritimatiellaeota bacterium]|nr:ATP-binding protein [Kiritimatiellota bacterium]
IGENVHLKLDLVAGLLNVKVDSGQMDQVLINLAINARDAMPKGGQLLLRTTNVKLSAEDLPLHPEGRAGHFVCLSITDNGTGMSREVQAHIFEPFFTTKEQGKGTGLGLSTVYGIIKQHDGWITVYSEPGLGTTFRVYLPALDDTSVVAPAAAVEIPPPTAHGERILIIEDDALVRRMAQQMLTRHGYRAVAVGSCAEALSAYNNLFALVLCDVILPDGNGLDLARQLQKQRPDLRCVLTSGYADIHERWPEIEQNRWPFLIKPFNQLDLRIYSKPRKNSLEKFHASEKITAVFPSLGKAHRETFQSLEKTLGPPFQPLGKREPRPPVAAAYGRRRRPQVAATVAPDRPCCGTYRRSTTARSNGCGDAYLCPIACWR